MRARWRHIATLEGKDPEQLISNFEQEESDSTTDKLFDALGLKAKKKKDIQDQLRSFGYEIKRIEKDDNSEEDAYEEDAYEEDAYEEDAYYFSQKLSKN